MTRTERIWRLLDLAENLREEANVGLAEGRKDYVNELDATRFSVLTTAGGLLDLEIEMSREARDASR
jgi:hypothetical protein